MQARKRGPLEHVQGARRMQQRSTRMLCAKRCRTPAAHHTLRLIPGQPTANCELTNFYLPTTNHPQVDKTAMMEVLSEEPGFGQQEGLGLGLGLGGAAHFDGAGEEAAAATELDPLVAASAQIGSKGAFLCR